MKRTTEKIFLASLLLSGTVVLLSQCASEKKQEPAVMTPEQMVERGRYLVIVAGCNDCHSPKIMTDKGPIVDDTRPLSGHRQDEMLPEIDTSVISPGKWYLGSSGLTSWVGPWGISFAANLTPDSATGTGAWTEELFLKILRSGKFMGVDAGRPIMPPMPWEQFAQLTDEDLKSIFAFLKTLKPIRNSVPAYVPPNEIPAGKKRI